MGKKRVVSVFQKIRDGIRKSVLFVVKLIYIAPFVAFGLWLINGVYFEDATSKAVLPGPGGPVEEPVVDIVVKEKAPVPREHFHLIDAYIKEQEPNPPLCVVCHGTYAHGKEKEIRAMLNLHTGFIACAVCHVRQNGEEAETPAGSETGEIEFLWVDKQTGEITRTTTGEYGKFPAKIYPIRFTEKGPRRIFTPIKTEAAQRFLRMRPELTSDEVSQAKAKLHEPLSKKAVKCGDCHQEGGYLNFRALGFSKQRVDHLISSEFVGMIDKYKTFYLPSVIDFTGN